MTLQDCLGKITRPVHWCESCIKDERNLLCPYYIPHVQIELIEIEPKDEYGEQGTINRNYMGEPPKRLDNGIL
jgi:hypothetical protein